MGVVCMFCTFPALVNLSLGSCYKRQLLQCAAVVFGQEQIRPLQYMFSGNLWCFLPSFAVFGMLPLGESAPCHSLPAPLCFAVLTSSQLVSGTWFSNSGAVCSIFLPFSWLRKVSEAIFSFQSYHTWVSSRQFWGFKNGQCIVCTNLASQQHGKSSSQKNSSQ